MPSRFVSLAVMFVSTASVRSAVLERQGFVPEARQTLRMARGDLEQEGGSELASRLSARGVRGNASQPPVSFRPFGPTRCAARREIAVAFRVTREIKRVLDAR